MTNRKKLNRTAHTTASSIKKRNPPLACLSYSYSIYSASVFILFLQYIRTDFQIINIMFDCLTVWQVQMGIDLKRHCWFALKTRIDWSDWQCPGSQMVQIHSMMPHSSVTGIQRAKLVKLSWWEGWCSL